MISTLVYSGYGLLRLFPLQIKFVTRIQILYDLYILAFINHMDLYFVI